jgi:CHAT domain-containing protein
LTGLARAFFFAGAKSLLVSQWSVDDVATQFLMTEIFKYYGSAKSIAPAEALRHGMQAAMAEAARNSGHAYFAHPFAWAAFFLVGEGNG